MGTHPIFESDFDCLTEMASRQLDEISKLEAELEKLFDSTGNENSKPEIEELKNENLKLIYQINTLKKAIQKEKDDIVPPKVMITQSIYDSLQSIFTVALASAFTDLVTPQAKLQPVADKMAKFGDYNCVSSMDISKIYKEKG